MFGMKSKADKKAAELEALGYEVVLRKSDDGTAIIFATKGVNKHTATYSRSKLIDFNSSVERKWHDVVSYQPTPTAPFVKDFI